jgi:hypothetical protein
MAKTKEQRVAAFMQGAAQAGRARALWLAQQSALRALTPGAAALLGQPRASARRLARALLARARTAPHNGRGYALDAELARLLGVPVAGELHLLNCVSRFGDRLFVDGT